MFVLVPINYTPENHVVVRAQKDVDDDELFYGLRPREADLVSWFL